MTATNVDRLGVAIVGMGALFPGASDLDSYWDNLIRGVDAIGEVPSDRLDPVFFDPSAHSAPDMLAAIYGYAVQIYCDFSAYSYMAIGLAALLGYRFLPNFDQPYRSASLQEFWRPWLPSRRQAPVVVGRCWVRRSSPEHPIA